MGKGLRNAPGHLKKKSNYREIGRFKEQKQFNSAPYALNGEIFIDYGINQIQYLYKFFSIKTGRAKSPACFY